MIFYQDKILKKVAEETGYPLDLIEFWYKEFWSSIRYYITHPLEAKEGIHLDSFIDLTIPESRLYRYIQRNYFKDSKRVEEAKVLFEQFHNKPILPDLPYYIKNTRDENKIKEFKKNYKEWLKTNQDLKHLLRT